MLFFLSDTRSSIGKNIIVAGSKQYEKKSFITTLNGTYPSLDMTMNLDLANSADVSNYILNKLDEKQREFNFGSFIFGDTINIGFNVNWNELNITSFSRNNGNDLPSKMPPTEKSDTEVQSTSMVGTYPNNDMNASNLDSSMNTDFLSEILNKSNPFMVFDKEAVNEAISKLLSTFVNRTINQLFPPEENLGEIFMKYAFRNSNNLTIGGDQWSAMVTQETVEDLLHTENVTYNMEIKVPSSIMHNSSSAHRLVSQKFYHVKKVATDISQFHS